MLNWPVELLELLALQQEAERASQGQDLAGSFGLAATEDELIACEHALGFRFEEHHREFLKFANGWERFSGTIDLFSTQDFLGSDRFNTALQWIREFDSEVFGSNAVDRERLFPIGKGEGSTSLLIMKRKEERLDSVVLWFANEPTEEFPSFDAMFVSFKEYTKGVIEFWRSQPQ